LTIDGRSVDVTDGATILDAAQKLGIAIPTLCHLQGTAPFTSCMICVVKDMTTGRLVPSCSAPAVDGMVVATDTEDVRLQRKNVLDLLLSEHAGDCEAPCRVTCPALMDVPQMLRLIADGRLQDAISTVREAIAMPGVTGHVCPAPCEKACRRGRHDAPVSICLVERLTAESDLPVNDVKRNPGKRVAIIGAGPAGLAAAYYLARAGHVCTVFDDHEEPGGQLRYRTSNAVLPFAVLNRDVEVIRRLGVEFRMKTRIEPGAGLEQLKAAYEFIVLAPGKFATPSLSVWGLAADDRGFKVDAATHRTSDPVIFAGGEAVHPGRMAVRAMAHGKTMAGAIDQMRNGIPATATPRQFNSRLGRLEKVELAEFVREANPAGRITPSRGMAGGFTGDEAAGESRRCLHCDCRRAQDCRLRDFSGRYNASQREFAAEGRLSYARKTSSPVARVSSPCLHGQDAHATVARASRPCPDRDEVIFESGKCIKCGICVRITAKAGAGAGLAFMGRGYGTEVGVPFDGPLETALGEVAAECVRECPTGALAWMADVDHYFPM